MTAELDARSLKVRTVERGYYASQPQRSARVTRVHVIREDGPHPGKQAMCGQHAYDVRNSEAIVRDVPHALPDGLSWCPKCVGHLAEKLGRLGEVARLLGAEVPGA